MSTNSTSTTVPKCEASTLAFISLPFVASSDSFTASLSDRSNSDQETFKLNHDDSKEIDEHVKVQTKNITQLLVLVS